MAWERGYYYRVRKVNGRVVREYVGKGRLANLAASLDADQRAARRLELAERRAETSQMEDLDNQVADLCELTDLLARAALIAAGYRQHHRGDWRRKRGQPDSNP